MSAEAADEMERRLRSLPSRTRFSFPERVVPSFFRRAAVLIAFWREADELYVVLTQRTTKLRSHPGMVSFPGGKLEPGESWEQAAVREAHEEVGLDPGAVEVLGRFDDAWSSAKHHLVPIAAWVDRVPELVANPDEVAKIMIVPVSEILRPGACSDETVYIGSVPRINTTIAVSAGEVFGLTADLLLEAVEWMTGVESARGLERLGELQDWNAARAEKQE